MVILKKAATLRFEPRTFDQRFRVITTDLVVSKGLNGDEAPF